MRKESMKNQLLTIFSDASHWKNAGGYAYWARGGEDRIQGSGTWPCDNISECETVAISVALMEALEKLAIEDGGSVVLQSDSLDALSVFRNLGYGRQAKKTDCTIRQFNKANDIQRAFVRKAGDMAHERGIKIWLKHVKGHSGKADGRSKVNAWCDGQAKAARRLCEAQMAAREAYDQPQES
jgi:hypothetical protein